MADEGERKHQPTARYRKKLREEGRFARSQDLGAALVLVTSLGILWLTGPGLFSKLQSMTDSSLAVRELPRQGELVDLFRLQISEALWLVLPLLAMTCATAVIYQWFQSGFQIFPSKLAPDWQRVNPIEGTRRLWSSGGTGRLGFGLLKIVVVALILGFEIWSAGDALLSTAGYSSAKVAAIVGTSLIQSGLKVALGLVALGLLEYGYQYWIFERSILMTDEELREELKSEAQHPQLAQRKNQLRQKNLGS
ncbi:MAG: EscU/YscU/HrcU family type III secretion system export apparatus switch protein [Planctomycetota bacterium]